MKKPKAKSVKLIIAVPKAASRKRTTKSGAKSTNPLSGSDYPQGDFGGGELSKKGYKK